MTGLNSRILLDLTAVGRGERLRVVTGFVPELVALRPNDSFAAIASGEAAGLAASWGISRIHPWRARRCDIALVAAPRGVLTAPAPRIVWADAQDLSAVGGAMLTRAVLGRAALVVYPTAAARYAAEHAGVRTPGVIVRPPLRTPSAPPVPDDRDEPGLLRVLVPADRGPGRNLGLLPRVSAVLADRGVEHHLTVMGDLAPELTSATVSAAAADDETSASALRERFDAVLLPDVTAGYSYPLVEFERLGFPVAASNIGAHLELRARAKLFDPASARGAAQALLDAVAEGPGDGAADDAEWRFQTPDSYAQSISTEIDRLLEHGESWER